MTAKKTVAKLPSLPPVAILRKAVVVRWEHEHINAPMDALAAELGHESSQGVRRIANLAAGLSSKKCFFCGEKRAETTNPVDWEQFELCGCLADLRRDEVWHKPVNEPADLLEILRAINSRELVDSTPIVTRSCGATKIAPDGTRSKCGERWTLRAGSLAHAVRNFLLLQADRDLAQGVARGPVERLADFQWPRKCKGCVRAAKERYAARDNAAPPTARQRAVDEQKWTEALEIQTRTWGQG